MSMEIDSSDKDNVLSQIIIVSIAQKRLLLISWINGVIIFINISCSASGTNLSLFSGICLNTDPNDDDFDRRSSRNLYGRLFYSDRCVFLWQTTRNQIVTHGKVKMSGGGWYIDVLNRSAIYFR